MKRNVGARLAGLGAVGALALAGCGSAGDGTVEIEFLIQSTPTNIAVAEALSEEFSAQNPNISISVDTRPGGGDGDNLIKTRLSTGEMADVFVYNTGSLFQAINPDQTLVEMSDQPWVDDLDEEFLATVQTDQGTYGQAWDATFGSGMLYNKAVYEDLGLEVPETWDEFMSNSEAIAEAGISPVVQTYGDTWTSQIFVLADFANVEAVDPDWAEAYTAGDRKYAEEPAIRGFEKLEEVAQAGYFNENYPSASEADGMRILAAGEGAHYPWQTAARTVLEQNSPDAVDDIGYFPIPADEAENTQAARWQASGLYVPQSTEGEEREAALAFLEFVNSDEGCAIKNEHNPPAGPHPGACELPDDVPQMVTDFESYVEAERVAPALEFLSPIKGPNLEHILVEVGSGIIDAETGAARYDEDVVNQARQLGLEGW